MLAFHPGTESKGLIAAAAALSADLEELGSMHLLTGSLASLPFSESAAAAG